MGSDNIGLYGYGMAPDRLKVKTLNDNPYIKNFMDHFVMNRLLLYLPVLALLACGLAACSKWMQPVYEQTSNGSGQLNFSTASGSYSEFSLSHDPLAIFYAFIPMPSHEPKAHADYHLDENDVISVRAYLEARGLFREYNWQPYRIRISAPLSEIADGAVLTPDIKVAHIVRPAIYSGINRRDAEFGETTVTDTWMKIHVFDPGKKTLTGFFSFRGEYADSTGRVRKIRVKDGFFDVSNDMITDQDSW